MEFCLEKCCYGEERCNQKGLYEINYSKFHKVCEYHKENLRAEVSLKCSYCSSICRVYPNLIPASNCPEIQDEILVSNLSNLEIINIEQNQDRLPINSCSEYCCYGEENCCNKDLYQINYSKYHKVCRYHKDYALAATSVKCRYCFSICKIYPFFINSQYIGSNPELQNTVLLIPDSRDLKENLIEDQDSSMDLPSIEDELSENPNINIIRCLSYNKPENLEHKNSQLKPEISYNNQKVNRVNFDDIQAFAESQKFNKKKIPCVNCNIPSVSMFCYKCTHSACLECLKTFCSKCPRRENIGKCSRCKTDKLLCQYVNEDYNIDKNCNHPGCLACLANYVPCSKCNSNNKKLKEKLCEGCNKKKPIDHTLQKCSHTLCNKCLIHCPKCTVKCLLCDGGTGKQFKYKCRHIICNVCHERCKICVICNIDELIISICHQCKTSTKSGKCKSCKNSICLQCSFDHFLKHPDDFCDNCHGVISKNIKKCSHKFCGFCSSENDNICMICDICKICLSVSQNQRTLSCNHKGCNYCSMNEICFECIFATEKIGLLQPQAKKCCMCNKESNEYAFLFCSHIVCKICKSKLEFKKLNYSCLPCSMTKFNEKCIVCQKEFALKKINDNDDDIDNIYYKKCCDDYIQYQSKKSIIESVRNIFKFN